MPEEMCTRFAIAINVQDREFDSLIDQLKNKIFILAQLGQVIRSSRSGAVTKEFRQL